LATGRLVEGRIHQGTHKWPFPKTSGEAILRTSPQEAKNKKKRKVKKGSLPPGKSNLHQTTKCLHGEENNRKREMHEMPAGRGKKNAV